MWSVGASALETIFDAGARRATNDEAWAAYQESVANYRQSVLTAVQEVEDNLAALRILEQEAATQTAAVNAAEHSLDLSITRYRGGVTNYLEVTTAQSSALADQIVAEQIRARRMTAAVLLIKALGGGWNASSLANVASTSSSSASPSPAATPATSGNSLKFQTRLRVSRWVRGRLWISIFLVSGARNDGETGTPTPGWLSENVRKR